MSADIFTGITLAELILIRLVSVIYYWVDLSSFFSLIITGPRCKSDHIQEETKKKLPTNKGPPPGKLFIVLRVCCTLFSKEAIFFLVICSFHQYSYCNHFQELTKLRITNIEGIDKSEAVAVAA